MGPDRKDKLKSPDDLTAKTQELDALILRSAKLVEQMQELIDQNVRLIEKQQSLLEERKKKSSE